MAKKIISKTSLGFFLLFSLVSFCLFFNEQNIPPNLYELNHGEVFEVTVKKANSEPKKIWYTNGAISIDNIDFMMLSVQDRDDFNRSFAGVYGDIVYEIQFCIPHDEIKYEIRLKRSFWNSKKWIFSTYSSCNQPTLIRLLPYELDQRNWPHISELFSKD